MAIKLSDIFNTNDINMNNPKIEEMLNKTKSLAEDLSKKSAEHLEVSRKKVEIIDAKAKLSKLYEKYGEIQFNASLGIEPDDERVREITDKIKLYREKIADLSEEVERAKMQFNEAVANATRKTRDVFQKEFDKMNKNEVVIEAEPERPQDDEIQVEDNSTVNTENQ